MRRRPAVLLFVPVLAVSCVGNPNRHTLADLHRVDPDMTEVRVENGLDQAMAAYQSFLQRAPKSTLTPEAMRRLADLKLEKDFGILGGADLVDLQSPRSTRAAESGSTERQQAAGVAAVSESEEDFERRATGEQRLAASDPKADVELPGGGELSASGPREAIALYDQILATYPNYEHNDQILYQKARAYDELGESDQAIAVIEELVAKFPHSPFIDEVQFRRGEYFFVRRRFFEAEQAYAAVTRLGVESDYYELALYKLGWTLYKQELYQEALDQYVSLLDYKVATGYDFEAAAEEGRDEEEGSRVADTYRVVSLSFSNLGGPEAVEQYFAAKGSRSYEDRIYSQLGDFYLEKLRYHDAAAAFHAFVDLHPLHRAAPHFSMRVVDVYEKGGFPKLVLESKKEFAVSYGLQAEYWQHFDASESPEVLSYLKQNLEDLANHYHALFQEETLAEQRPENFAEALHWYRDYLASFPEDPKSPSIDYRLADLLLEHEDFGEAAREYEHTAYDYPEHEQSAEAGYAAIYAHRQDQERAEGERKAQVQREAVASTLRFVERFPDHEHAAVVLGAAVDDLYEMKEYARAITTARQLIADYPEAQLPVRRSAWTVIAHASLDTSDYVQAENAYSRVLEMTPEQDDSRQDVIDNLAAAIYKQGEQAKLAGDYRTAADHFLRIAQVAPTSSIRASAEYDAGAALIELGDLTAAATVLDTFRESHPEHELYREATKQIALIYREQGELSRSAEEYERVAKEADDDELRREALLLAGELYGQAEVSERALAVYLDYVKRFPEPLDVAVETRFKVAELYEKTGQEEKYHDELRRIVEIDASAGAERTPRIRYLAARSALALTEPLYRSFDEVALVQPFEKHLKEKQKRMNLALDAFGKLVDYEVGEVTAAATFYMAEIFSGFSKALMESERPDGLTAAELQDYDDVLEEEAFPFEERAIKVHEKNVELMAGGVYNQWIEKSIGRLGVLMPGRYAKYEASTGPLESIDSYAYRVPIARKGPVGAGGEEKPAQPSEIGPSAAAPEAPEADPAGTEPTTG